MFVYADFFQRRGSRKNPSRPRRKRTRRVAGLFVRLCGASESELVAQAAPDRVDRGSVVTFLSEVIVQVFGTGGKVAVELVFKSSTSRPTEVGGTRIRDSGAARANGVHFGMTPAG